MSMVEPGWLTPGTRVWWTWPLPGQPKAQLRAGVVLAQQSHPEDKTLVSVVEVDTGAEWLLYPRMNIGRIDQESRSDAEEVPRG